MQLFVDKDHVTGDRRTHKASLSDYYAPCKELIPFGMRRPFFSVCLHSNLV